MTYHAGFSFGPNPHAPYVRCDECGTTLIAETRSGGPPTWLLNRKAPKGWLLIRREQEDGSVFRRDYCPRCRVAIEMRGRP